MKPFPGFVNWWKRRRTVQSPALPVLCGAAANIRSPRVDGMTMSIGLSRIELTGRRGFLGLGASFSDQTSHYFKRGFVWLPTILIAGAGAWLLLSGEASNTAVSEPSTGTVRLAAAVANDPLAGADATAQGGSPHNLVPAPAQGAVPAQMTPIDGLKIASQSWRRGGLGSKALVTFTLRNANDFAVKDIEISCAFTRRDGSHLTERRRTIPDVVNMKSRKTFARMHVGFVNVNADQAKCSLVTASRV
jgi:hypothetical protein